MSAQHSPDRSRRGARREQADDGDPVLVGRERHCDLSVDPVVRVVDRTAGSRVESVHPGSSRRLFDVIRAVLPANRSDADPGAGRRS